MKYIAGFLGALLLSVSGPLAHAKAPESHSDTCRCHYAYRTVLRTAAQAVVQNIVEKARQASAFDGDIPIVKVETTPPLIWIDLDSRPAVIRLPWWDELPPEIVVSFKRWAGGDEAAARRLFDQLFHRFLIAHETAHWLRAQRRGHEPANTFYDGENQANRFAAAYWQSTEGGPAFLATLERALEVMMAALRDPTPPGQDPVQYFGEHYETLGSTPDDYAYYQTVFMLRAVKERRDLSVPALIREMDPPEKPSAAH